MSPIFKISLLLFSCLELYATTCYSPGKIRTVEFNKKKISKDNFCVEHPDYLLISQKCLKKSCLALTQYKKKSIYNSNSPVGNPLYRKCRSKGGKGKMIEYFHKKWIETGICLFADNSFISIFNNIE